MAKIWNPFWIEAIQTEFVPQINATVDVLEERLLANISEEDIEAESERLSDERWEESMSMPGTGDEDPGDFVDKAVSAGVSHYGLMIGIRQGIINLFAVALYHAFDQQTILFHRKNVLHPNEENNPELLRMSVFHCRLKKYGIDKKKLSSWAKIDELRLVANTVKHADGHSSRELREIRPDMFENPLLSSSTRLRCQVAQPVFQPLVGDGLYVSVQDIRNYRNRVVRFWEELVDYLKCG